MMVDRVNRVEVLLCEGDALLAPAFVDRDAEAMNRLYAITYELTNDHGYNGAELARRWRRNRRTISVWKKAGAELLARAGQRVHGFWPS